MRLGAAEEAKNDWRREHEPRHDGDTDGALEECDRLSRVSFAEMVHDWN